MFPLEVIGKVDLGWQVDVEGGDLKNCIRILNNTDKENCFAYALLILTVNVEFNMIQKQVCHLAWNMGYRCGGMSDLIYCKLPHTLGLVVLLN